MAQIAHDVGLAAWSGGATMGAAGVNGATREVDDHTQRLRVADAAWFRWAPVAAAAIGIHVLGALRLRRLPAASLPTEATASQLVRLSVTLAAVAATLEAGRCGRRVVAAGDVPVATAVLPISDTPPTVATAQRRLRIAQWLVPAFTGAIWIVNAVQVGRRTPARQR